MPSLLFAAQSGDSFYPKYRVNIKGGYSSSQIDNFDRGGHISVDMSTFLINKYLGLGLRYSRFMARSTESVGYDGAYYSSTYGSSVAYSVDEQAYDVVINFVGPILTLRHMSESKKFSCYANAGLGWYGLIEVGDSSSDKVTGNTYAGVLGLGFDVRCIGPFFLNFDLSYYIASFKEYKDSSSEVIKVSDPCNRLDLSLGFALNF